MNKEEFKEEWSAEQDNLRPIPRQTMDRFKMNKESSSFLTDVGLPVEAAPFLNFVGDSRMEDKWDSIAFLNENFQFLPAEYGRYVVIGSDGNSDVIAVNTQQNCIIEWLDHEAGFSPRYMNGSLLQLAFCLLAYRNYMKAITQNREKNKVVDYKFTRRQMDLLRQQIGFFDQKALEEGFWNFNLDMV